MRERIRAAALFAVLSFLISCSGDGVLAPVTEWNPGFYSVRLDVSAEESRYGVIEVLGETEGGARVRIFGDLFTERPAELRPASLQYVVSSEISGWGGVEVVMRDDVLTGMNAEPF